MYARRNGSKLSAAEPARKEILMVYLFILQLLTSMWAFYELESPAQNMSIKFIKEYYRIVLSLVIANAIGGVNLYYLWHIPEEKYTSLLRVVFIVSLFFFICFAVLLLGTIGTIWEDSQPPKPYYYKPKARMSYDESDSIREDSSSTPYQDSPSIPGGSDAFCDGPNAPGAGAGPR